ncbi:MAG: CDP-alcohol phosphatidyltransferase family protein [Candidatus Krumholzibacteriota bacterium]|nr:CDP-alcohol phosphatidyltransferase family protein [Candidatus Krumholzibacteriota bacterium]
MKRTKMKIPLRHWFYLSNLLSLSRIGLAIPIFFLLRREGIRGDPLLISLVGIIILTDYLDGLASRGLGQITVLGKFLDPLADKIAMGLLFLALVAYQGFPPLLVFLLVFRDLAILLGGMVINHRRAARDEGPVSANRHGKLNTVVFSLTGLIFLLNLPAPLFKVFYSLCFITLFLSGWKYYREGEAELFRGRGRHLARVLLAAVTVLVLVLSWKLSPAGGFLF